MQYTYDIVPDDFVALNINFANNDPVMGKSIQKLRKGATMLVFFGGLIFMLALGAFTPVAVLVYAVLAALVYKFMPVFFQRSMKKNVEKTIRNASSKSICGPKTFTMGETDCTLTGEEENSTYPYSAFSKVVVDTDHYYLFLDDVSALIIPFRAFAAEQEKQAFYTAITDKINAAKAENGETDVDKPEDSV